MVWTEVPPDDCLIRVFERAAVKKLPSFPEQLPIEGRQFILPAILSKRVLSLVYDRTRLIVSDHVCRMHMLADKFLDSLSRSYHSHV